MSASRIFFLVGAAIGFGVMFMAIAVTSIAK